MRSFPECQKADKLRYLIRETFAEYEKNAKLNPNVSSPKILVQSLEELCDKYEEEERTVVDVEDDDNDAGEELKMKSTPEKMNVELPQGEGRCKRVIRAPVKFSPDEPDNAKDDKSVNGQSTEPKKRRRRKRRQNFEEDEDEEMEKNKRRKLSYSSPQKSSVNNNNNNNSYNHNVNPKKSSSVQANNNYCANDDHANKNGDSECYDVDHNYSRSRPPSSAKLNGYNNSSNSSVQDGRKPFEYSVIDYNHPPVLNGSSNSTTTTTSNNCNNNNNNNLLMMIAGQSRGKGHGSSVHSRGGSSYFDTLRLPGSHPSVPVVTQFPHSVEEIVVIDLVEEVKVPNVQKKEEENQDEKGAVAKTKKKKVLASTGNKSKGDDAVIQAAVDNRAKRKKVIMRKPRKKLSKLPVKTVKESDEVDNLQSRKRTKKSELSIPDEDGRLFCVLCGDDRTYKNRNTLYNHRSIYHNKRRRSRKPSSRKTTKVTHKRGKKSKK